MTSEGRCVLVTARYFWLDDSARAYLERANCEVVSGGYDGTVSDAGLSGGALIDALDGVDVAIGAARFSREVMNSAPRLRGVCRRGVGYEKVDVEAATELGVLVTITPGAMDGAVAEHAVALMFAVSRRIVESHGAVLTGTWSGVVGTSLEGKTLGVIGLGRIGRKMAAISHGLGMEVIAFDVGEPATLDVPLVPLEELLARSDVISIHAALTSTSHHLLGSAELHAMKRSAILINTARGGVIDEPALVDALNDGVIAGAGLDTYESEPPSPDDFLSLPNVVLTPHSAGYTYEALSAANLMAAKSAVAILDRTYEDVAGIVNPAALEMLRDQRDAPL